MSGSVNDEVKLSDGRIGRIEKVIHLAVNGESTDEIYCYEMNIDGVSGRLVYPDEIETDMDIDRN